MTLYDMIQVLPAGHIVKVEEFGSVEIFEGLPHEIMQGEEMHEREVLGVRANLAGIIVLEVE